MTKRITSLILVTMLVVSLFAFVGCERVDEEYCLTAQTALQNYAESKGKDSYSAENWSLITSKLAKAKECMQKSKNNQEVDELLSDTKAYIDTIPFATGDVWRLGGELQTKIKQDYIEKVLADFPEATIENVVIKGYYGQECYASYTDESIRGEVYILEIMENFSNYEACDIAGMSLEANHRIIVWQENTYCIELNDFWSQDINVSVNSVRFIRDEGLDLLTYMHIRELRLSKITDDFTKYFSWWFREYYGTYNGAVVGHFSGTWQQVVDRETVAGIEFIYPTPDYIKVFKNDKYYTLTQAYELGYINEENILSIKEKYDTYHLF